MPQFEQGEEGNFVSVKRAASAWEKFRFGTGWRSKILLAGKMKVIREAGKSFSSQFQIFDSHTATYHLLRLLVRAPKSFVASHNALFFFIRNKYKKQRIRIFRISIADLRNSVVNFIENPQTQVGSKFFLKMKSMYVPFITGE